MTDDPDGVQAQIASLAANTQITLLSVYSSGGTDWAYIEAQTSAGLMRGFVPVECVSNSDNDYSWDDEVMHNENG